MTRYKLLAVVLPASALVFAGAVFLLIRANTNRGQDLCGVLYSMIASSGATIGKPGYPGYAYFQKHAKELRVARQQNRDFLQALPCQRGALSRSAVGTHVPPPRP